MSHTAHRRGPRENFDGEFIFLCMTAKGINEVGSSKAIQEFLTIINKYDLTNMGDMKTGNKFVVDRGEIIGKIQDTSIVQGVFTDKEQAKAALKELKEADLGVSIVVTGIVDDVHQLCLSVGINRHTVECSLGIHGQISKLPEEDLLELTTMCGHGMVPHRLVRKFLVDIKNGELTPEQAAEKLATPCVCGIFNPRRAAVLLTRLAELWICDQE